MSHSSVSAPKRNRQSNYTAAEIALIADEVKLRSRVLFGSFSSTVTNQAKLKEWDEIASKLNACSSVMRNGAQIRKKWNDYKSQVKRKAIDVRKESVKTGGGPPPASLTDLENKVASLIPRCQLEGIPGGLDSEIYEAKLQEGETPTEDHQEIPEESSSVTDNLPSATYLSEELAAGILAATNVDLTMGTTATEEENSLSSSSTAREVKMMPTHQKQRRNSSKPKTCEPPKYITSLLTAETNKADTLKDILAVQKRMLTIAEEQLLIDRERLALEKLKFEFKKKLMSDSNTKSASNDLSLSPVIKFLY